MNEAKVALGRQLFFDKRLSGDRSRACISCHRPEAGLTEGGTPTSGAYEIPNGRSCPTLWNAGYQQAFYWEGAGRSLEQAAAGVWRFLMAPGGGEGRLATADVAARLNAIPGYRSQFERVFGAPADPENVPKALAASCARSWPIARAGSASTTATRARSPPGRARGYAVFDKQARCTNCHNGQLLTDLQFHNVGIGSQKAKPELGPLRDHARRQGSRRLQDAVAAERRQERAVLPRRQRQDARRSGRCHGRRRHRRIPHLDRVSLARRSSARNRSARSWTSCASWTSTTPTRRPHYRRRMCRP
jgi:cytochrome c peroxidase